jgi:hypothetical protein
MRETSRCLLRSALAAAAIAAGVPSVSSAAPCDRWTEHAGTQLFRDGAGPAYWYVTAHKAVDADGAPNAYHPDDVGQPCRDSGRGLDCPANAGYPGASWWPDVLVADSSDASRAYVRPAGPFAGYFVSKTALADRTKADTDEGKYVDATAVPYVVFPGRFYRLTGTGRLGDLGIAIHLDSGLTAPFIVADIGPSDALLGEASIALFERLGGSNVNARTGAGVPSGNMLYVVFPYERIDEQRPWPASQAEIGARVEELAAQRVSLERIKACAASLPSDARDR